MTNVLMKETQRRDTKRRESHVQKKAQTGVSSPVQGIPMASRRGHEWTQIPLKPLEGVLPTPWFWTSSFVNCNHLLTGLLSPASAPLSPPPHTSCQRSCPRAQLWLWYVHLKNVQRLLLPTWQSVNCKPDIQGHLSSGSFISLQTHFLLPCPSHIFCSSQQNYPLFHRWTSCLCSFFFGQVACEILALQGLGKIEPMAPEWKHRVLTTGPPGKSLLLPLLCLLPGLHLCIFVGWSVSALHGSTQMSSLRKVLSFLSAGSDLYCTVCVSPWFPRLQSQGCSSTHLWTWGWGRSLHGLRDWFSLEVYRKNHRYSSMWSFWAGPLYLLESRWMVLWALQALLKSVLAPKHKKKTANMKLIISSKKLLYAAAAAKLLQSCPTLCDPIDGSPPGSAVPGILQARTLEWVAISFSNAWKWKVKGKSLSRVQLFSTPQTAAHQAPLSMGFPRQKYWSGLPLLSPTYFILKRLYTKM